jgi:DNA-binding MarR family transcriptional regulator
VAERSGSAAFDAELATRLGSFIKRAEQALMAEKTRVLRGHGLTVAQYSVLMMLRYVPEASAAQLSRACLVTPQTMATILGNLEQKGLVSREPSPLHLRVVSTRLTDTGAVVAEKADAAAKDVERRLGSRFTEAERAQLMALLERATAVLQQAPGEPGD